MQWKRKMLIFLPVYLREGGDEREKSKNRFPDDNGWNSCRFWQTFGPSTRLSPWALHVTLIPRDLADPAGFNSWRQEVCVPVWLQLHLFSSDWFSSLHFVPLCLWFDLFCSWWPLPSRFCFWGNFAWPHMTSGSNSSQLSTSWSHYICPWSTAGLDPGVWHVWRIWGKSQINSDGVVKIQMPIQICWVGGISLAAPAWISSMDFFPMKISTDQWRSTTQKHLHKQLLTHVLLTIIIYVVLHIILHVLLHIILHVVLQIILHVVLLCLFFETLNLCETLWVCI